jgi:uracil permease
MLVKAKGFFKVIPFLVGILAGYLSSIVLGMVDFTAVSQAAWIQVPNFQIPFISYTPNWIVALTMAPIALVTMAEHIGDHTALSTIIGKDLLKEPGLERTLLGDGVATFVAGLIGAPANTTYGENTSVVGMTRVASVKVIGMAAIFAIVIGFLGKFTALVSTIPNAVLGGVSLLLYGFIAVNGLKVLIKNQVDFENNKNIAIASTMLVIGLGGATISITSGDLDLAISGMSLAAVVGIILNLILPGDSEIYDDAVVVVDDDGDVEVAVDTEYKDYGLSNIDMIKLKNDIKDELTIELKDEMVNEIKRQLKKK